MRAAAARRWSRADELDAKRRTLLQLLFVEGNRFCPWCEKSGDCALQATAYELGMLTPHFDHFYPDRPVDAPRTPTCCSSSTAASCASCACAPAAMSMARTCSHSPGAAPGRIWWSNSDTGRLADTDFAATDRAAAVCPVGVILKKRVGFAVPIGQRTYDRQPISAGLRADDKAGAGFGEAG